MKPKHPVHSQKPASETPRGADWMAWGLQLILGFIVGAAAGILVAMRFQGAGFIAHGNLLQTTLGAACVVAGAASHFGDRFWARRSIFDPPEFPRSQFSATLSLVVALFGATNIALVLVDSWKGRRWLGESMSAASIPLLLMAAVFFGLCGYGLRTGTLIGIHFRAERDETPFFFWLYFIIQAGAGVGIVLAVLR